MRTKALFEYDTGLKTACIAGIDEAGRGPLAGPVVAACCVLPLQTYIEGIDDSKRLSECRREQIYEEIVRQALAYSVSAIDHTVIDEINILNATKLAMRDCVDRLTVQPDLVLIDAVRIQLPYPVSAIIKGDATSYHIAAASILAKVTRDRIMREMDKKYPRYGFASNKGYGTAAHIEAIQAFGPCEIHRQGFIRNFI